MLSTLANLPIPDSNLAGIVASAVLAVLLVALSTYGRRCRHPVLRLVFWGASTAFMPLTSFVLSSLLKQRQEEKENLCHEADDCPQLAFGKESPEVQNMWALLLWVVLILIIKGNADNAADSAAAAAVSPSSGDATVDAHKVRIPVELLVKYAWLGFLIVSCIPEGEWLGKWIIAFAVLFVLGFAKVALKLGAFFRGSGSYAVGKNARLVSGYMAQLVEDGEEEGHGGVPPYIVMGESKEHVEESPKGFRIKRDALDNKYSALVTLDRVWLLSDHGDGLLAKRRELRDLCLSFSLFKTLRRRLSGYPLAEEGSSNALDFVLRGMDTAAGDGKGDADADVGADADRVFRVLVDELWFASDFYYSPLPLCSFSGWCAALNYLLSFLIVAGAVTVGWIYQYKEVVVFDRANEQKAYYVITFFLLLVVVLTETWEIIAGVCSNWTKMALLGHYITRESCCGGGAAALDAVLRFRPARRWSDKIGQNSVLEPRRFGRRSGFYSEKKYGRAGLMRSVEVSAAVKDAVIRSLRSSYGGMNKGSAAARRVGLGGKVDWAWPPAGPEKSMALDGDGGSSTTEHILACHIGTRLFEIKYSHAAAPKSAAADMTAACHLSYYCAYLVAAAPGLLPDSEAWTEKRYKDVAEDVRAALAKEDAAASESTAQRYERLVKALSASSRDRVLRRGAELGRRLVEAYVEEEESAAAWRFLADFWSEMVLFVAPSQNVKGHVEAMGRGGEFVTLVWALLLHAGVTARPEMPGSSIP